MKEVLKLARRSINNLIASSHLTDPQPWRDARQDSVAALTAIDKALAQTSTQCEKQPAQEPVIPTSVLTAISNAGFTLVQTQHAYHLMRLGKIEALSTAPQQQEPRNFCSRCGKRTADLTAIHTCTPPRGLEMT